MANVYAVSAFNMKTLDLGEFFSRMESYSSALSGETFPTTIHDVTYLDYFQLTSFNFGLGIGQTLRLVSEDDLVQPSAGAPFNAGFAGSANGVTLYEGAAGEELTERWHIGNITVDPALLLDAVQTASTADEFAILKGEFGGADRFELSPKADYVFGFGGADTINGNGGADTLRGGTGADLMSGGNGEDDFIFDDRDTGKGVAGRDVIIDFQRGADDLDLRLIDANSARAGDQAFAYGDTNGDARADFEIRLNDVSGLLKSDFLL